MAKIKEWSDEDIKRINEELETKKVDEAIDWVQEWLDGRRDQPYCNKDEYWDDVNAFNKWKENKNKKNYPSTEKITKWVYVLTAVLPLIFIVKIGFYPGVVLGWISVLFIPLLVKAYLVSKEKKMAKIEAIVEERQRAKQLGNKSAFIEADNKLKKWHNQLRGELKE